MVNLTQQLLEYFDMLDTLELLPQTEDKIVDKLLMIVLIKPLELHNTSK